MSYHYYTTAEHKYIKKCFEELDLSIKEIAEQVGTTYCSMQKRISQLRKTGYITQNRKNKQTIQRYQKALALLKNGVDSRLVAERTGYKPQTIFRYKMDNGLVVRNQKQKETTLGEKLWHLMKQDSISV
jgi:DNA-binding IclR family transcriptional regulator